MRIGLIYHQFRTSAGGLERYLNGFATHLAKDGHQLTLIGTEFDDEFRSIPDATIAPVECSGSKASKMIQFADRSANTTTELKLDLTIGFGRTHSHDLHRAGGGCHRVYSRMLPAHKRLRKKNRLELELEEKLYTSGLTKHFVVNTGLVGKQLQDEYGVASNQITTIHTPVDPSKFSPAEDKIAAKKLASEQTGSPAERPAFLFVSLNHRRKGLSALLDVWSEVDADLWVAGAPLRRKDQSLIRAKGISERVFHFGQVADLESMYQAADGFLHPTLYDACANTVLQSLACGTPGLISSMDGASEFIKDGENGFLLENPEDRQQVLAGIQKITNLESDERERISNAARETIIPLTWQNHLAKWFEVIKTLNLT